MSGILNILRRKWYLGFWKSWGKIVVVGSIGEIWSLSVDKLEEFGKFFGFFIEILERF